MSFLRHQEIFRPMCSSRIQSWAKLPPPVGRHRAQPKGRTGRSTPWPIVTMSLQLAIPQQVALQQSLPPLHQLQVFCYE